MLYYDISDVVAVIMEENQFRICITDEYQLYKRDSWPIQIL